MACVHSLQPALWRRYASSRADEAATIQLAKLKFVKEDAAGATRATIGGVLLAAEDPREWLPNAYVQAVRYGGTKVDGNRQLDAQDIAGPLDAQIKGAMRFVLRNRRVAACKDPARREVPEYSERAVFEAVVNAVVHRDYAATRTPRRGVGGGRSGGSARVRRARHVRRTHGRGSLHSRTLNRSSSSMRSGSVPLCSSMPRTILRGTPNPAFSM